VKIFLSCFLVSILFFQSCSHKYDRQKIWALIKSDSVNSIIEATIEIQEAKDTGMVDALMYKSEDPLITHLSKYKGMSVYQIKMLALKSVTGIAPPKEITYTVDTAVIHFYRRKLQVKSA